MILHNHKLSQYHLKPIKLPASSMKEESQQRMKHQTKNS